MCGFLELLFYRNWAKGQILALNCLGPSTDKALPTNNAPKKVIFYVKTPKSVGSLLYGRSSLLKDFYLMFDSLTRILSWLFCIQISSCISISMTCECDEPF
jgi:hypothetical protein